MNLKIVRIFYNMGRIFLIKRIKNYIAIRFNVSFNFAFVFFFTYNNFSIRAMPTLNVFFD